MLYIGSLLRRYTAGVDFFEWADSLMFGELDFVYGVRQDFFRFVDRIVSVRWDVSIKFFSSYYFFLYLHNKWFRFNDKMCMVFFCRLPNDLSRLMVTFVLRKWKGFAGRERLNERLVGSL